MAGALQHSEQEQRHTPIPQSTHTRTRGQPPQKKIHTHVLYMKKNVCYMMQVCVWWHVCVGGCRYVSVHVVGRARFRFMNF